MLTLATNMPREVLISQLQSGLILLVLGMGTVFVFLVLLIYSTKAISSICRRITPAQASAPAPKKSTPAPAAKAAGNKDAEVAAAIAAAYQKNKN